MAQLLVRNLDDEVKKRLQRRAARHGRSTEEEVREILRAAADRDEPGPSGPGLGTRIAPNALPASALRMRCQNYVAELRSQPSLGRNDPNRHTNVLSALMHDPPDIAVVAWIDQQNAEDIWTSTVTVFEVRFGLARMAVGHKRAALEAAFDGLLREDLAGRIALFDRAAAEAAGQLAARREAMGRTVDVRDTLIAGIALEVDERSWPAETSSTSMISIQG